MFPPPPCYAKFLYVLILHLVPTLSKTNASAMLADGTLCGWYFFLLFLLGSILSSETNVYFPQINSWLRFIILLMLV